MTRYGGKKSQVVWHLNTNNMSSKCSAYYSTQFPVMIVVKEVRKLNIAAFPHVLVLKCQSPSGYFRYIAKSFRECPEGAVTPVDYSEVLHEEY